MPEAFGKNTDKAGECFLQHKEAEAQRGRKTGPGGSGEKKGQWGEFRSCLVSSALHREDKTSAQTGY